MSLAYPAIPPKTARNQPNDYNLFYINGQPAGKPVQLNEVPATYNLVVSKGGFATNDNSVVFTVANTDASGREVPGDSAIVDLELDEFTATGLVQNDADRDGMPDWWELQLAGGAKKLLVSSNDAALDADGDGLPNLAEFIAGTDPTDASSAFIVTPAPKPAGEADIVFAWKSRPGRVYAVDWSPDLGTAFTTLQANLPANPSGTNAWLWNATTNRAGFLRIKVSRVGGL